MIRVVVTGALGKMGRTAADEIAAEEGMELVGAIESPGHAGLGTLLHGIEVEPAPGNSIASADVVVDFTCPAAALELASVCAAAGTPFITGTTGLSGVQSAAIEKFSSKIPVIISPNMSVGVNLLFRIAGEISRSLPDFDVEIVEIHHNRKKDSPSGTAARLAQIVGAERENPRIVHGREGAAGPRSSEEIGMHSLRGGDVTGEHTVIFAGQGERLEIAHRAHSRRNFARGTIRAIRFISGRGPGLYTMADVLETGR